MEREEISRGEAQGHTVRAIARQLGRQPSTISRELRRNRNYRNQYRAAAAMWHARQRAKVARRPRKLQVDSWLQHYVVTHLTQGWSPQQIVGRLRRDYPDDMDKRISHETIYAAIYIIPRGELRRSFVACLRQHRTKRRPRRRSGQLPGQIPNMIPIAARPAEIEQRLVPGHWEGDLIKGRDNASAIGTLVERTTRLVLLARMPGRDSLSAIEGFSRKLRALPGPLRKSMTYDQGKEMARHALLTKRLRLKVYFADPHSPWQRGSNENTNGLLRQYLPTSLDFNELSQRELNAVAERLNNRPRQTLDWMTPNEAWEAQLKLINVALGT